MRISTLIRLLYDAFIVHGDLDVWADEAKIEKNQRFSEAFGIGSILIVEVNGKLNAILVPAKQGKIIAERSAKLLAEDAIAKAKGEK